MTQTPTAPSSADDAWRRLESHAATRRPLSLREAFASDPGRFERFSIEAAGLLLDYSKQLVTEETVALLIGLARARGLPDWIVRMFAGEAINLTEHRPALHVALRNASSLPMAAEGQDVMPSIHEAKRRMGALVAAVRDGAWRGATGAPIRDVVNLGIGGSHLGPLMAAEALRPYWSASPRVHFVANVDASHLLDTLAGLDPATTLFVVSSKSFTTQETLANARAARRWLEQAMPDLSAPSRHMVASTSRPDRAAELGIVPENVFPMWDWVGGRFSLWSVIGLPVAMAVGMDRFEALLDGAWAMDRHFREAPLERNMPVLLGLLGVWNTNVLGAPAWACLPYDQHLCHLPAYLQQLEMESNGKRTHRHGSDLERQSAAIVFGEAGTTGQHSFYQLLHQGTRVIPADFIAAAEPSHGLEEHHVMLLSNCLAQSEALMLGCTREEAATRLRAQGASEEVVAELVPHKTFPGNRPSNTLLMRRLEPATLGALIALYEHKTFVQGVIWDVNSFDQWGVELGKQLSDLLLPELAGPAPVTAHDSSTNGLAAYLKRRPG